MADADLKSLWKGSRTTSDQGIATTPGTPTLLIFNERLIGEVGNSEAASLLVEGSPATTGIYFAPFTGYFNVSANLIIGAAEAGQVYLSVWVDGQERYRTTEDLLGVDNSAIISENLKALSGQSIYLTVTPVGATFSSLSLRNSAFTTKVISGDSSI